MASSKSTHDSYWLAGKSLESKHPKLEGREKTEVVVLGGGITGLSTAIELLDRGSQVVVLEALTIGAGTTGGSTGHLDAHPESGPKSFIQKAGPELARLMTQLRLDAIDTIEKRAGTTADVRRVAAYYYQDQDHNAHSQSHEQRTRESLKEEMEAAETLGLKVSWQEHIPLPGAAYGYQIDGMARMDSLAYVRHLADEVIKKGGRIFENSIASGPLGQQPTSIAVEQGEIEFEKAVCAVHCNYTEVMRTYFQTPAYQSYVLAIRVTQAVPDALFWDTHDPYHYIRHASSDDSQLLIVGGCDGRTGAHQSLDAFQELIAYAKARFSGCEIVHKWSAELFEPVDGLPIIGQVAGKDNVWIATGLSGVGLTWGTAAAKILATQIHGQKTDLDDLLSPGRFALTSLPTMVAEQSVAAANYTERLLPSETIDLTSIKAGEGRVGKLNGESVAACRDLSGGVHVRSPICTHMGGVLHWNAAEQTWDCPVHGGRFCAKGERLYGPPEDPMEMIKNSQASSE